MPDKTATLELELNAADIQPTPDWAPYYETTIKVGRNPGKLQLAVPYEAPKKTETSQLAAW